MGTRCDERDLLERFKVVGTNSSHVRESNTDFDSGFQAMDSGFQVLDSVTGTWISDSLSCIPDSAKKNFLYSKIRIQLHGANPA